MEEINYILPDCSSHPSNIYLKNIHGIGGTEEKYPNNYEDKTVDTDLAKEYNELDSFPCPVVVIWNDTAYFDDSATPYFDMFKIGKAYCYIIIDPLDYGTFRVRVESSGILLLLQQRCKVETTFPSNEIPFLRNSTVSKFNLGKVVRDLIRKITLYINALNHLATAGLHPRDNFSLVDEYIIEKMKARIVAIENITKEHTEKQTSSYNYRGIKY